MLSPLATAPVPNPNNHITNCNIRHAHYRRIPSSQRPFSPPPQKKPISFKVIKNVFCLPLHRKGSGERKDDSEDGEAAVMEGKEEVVNFADSTISSEEQTKAPEGDKLPIFTRLRDWTAHQRTARDGSDPKTKNESAAVAISTVTALPPSSVSIPARVPPLEIDIPLKSRTPSDAQFSGYKLDFHKTVKWQDDPIFESSNSLPRHFQGLVPPPTPPKIPLHSNPPQYESLMGKLGFSIKDRAIPPPAVPPKIPLDQPRSINDEPSGHYHPTLGQGFTLNLHHHRSTICTIHVALNYIIRRGEKREGKGRLMQARSATGIVGNTGIDIITTIVDAL
ncbi:hypothetical protein ABW20_dc0106033 [Dactylellina cionopaga]|nr:hypothetical protein ABW20_dc0106033 [Dactylellina cionopaga]